MRREKKSRRGRKKVAIKILKEINEKDEKGDYIVVYDFGKRIPTEFYKGIEYLKEETKDDGIIINRWQKSVYYTNSKQIALAIKSLAEHYHAKVLVLRISEVL